MNSSIMIMCEPSAPQAESGALDEEMTVCALHIAGEQACPITAVMPAHGASPAPMRGADLLVLDSAAFTHYSSEAWEQAALEAAERLNPGIIIIPHTSAGYDYAPRLAAMLNCPCITSVTSIEKEPSKILFTRAGFNARFDIFYEAGAFPAVITVMPGAFSSGGTAASPGAVEHACSSVRLEKTSGITITKTREKNPGLDNADVVISAGRGIGREENLDIIRSMAGLFQKSSIAGSRVLCDNGWIEHKYQVGLTGTKVSPLLYVACGISGSPQHIAGMKDSATVVSVNHDADAAIFHHSDICIVEELEKFIPAFVETAGRHAQKK